MSFQRIIESGAICNSWLVALPYMWFFGLDFHFSGYRVYQAGICRELFYGGWTLESAAP
jgi:hypothetical protein